MDIPNNSDNFREQSAAPDRKKIPPVVTGAVKKKRSGLKELTDGFIQEDAVTVRNSLWHDILIPAAKKTIEDLLMSAVEMFFYGGTGRTSSRSRMDRVSWREGQRTASEKPAERIRSTSGYRFDEVLYPTRADAERVLNVMIEILDQYPTCSVSDYYSASNVTGSYTDNNYGWDDASALYGAKIVRFNDGWLLKLPNPKPLN